MGSATNPMENRMSKPPPDFHREIAKLRVEVMMMQEAMGLMLGLADGEALKLVVERLGSIAKLTATDESQEVTVAAAKQVLQGIKTGLDYGAKNASPLPR
jgi:hypothetical protein